MDVVTDLEGLPRPSRSSVVTIGAYDGVHVGHQALFRRVVDMARERGWDSTVVTFDRHPASVVRPKSAPLLLTDTEQKLELLAAAGVDRTVVLRFDEERSREPAEDFVTDVLVDGVAAGAVVVGSDFRFGHGGKGNVELLRRLGADLGFEVVGIDLVGAGHGGDGSDGVPVSSTRIRQLLSAGDVEAAAAMLGRPHEVRGSVVHGDGRGRELGFPTANIAVPAGILLPADGIYAGWYERPASGGGRAGVHPAAVSVGRRPTFYEHLGAPVLEAYLLDFDEDLYGERARVRFTTRLRGDQERFASVDELVAQMARDVTAARAALA